MYPINEQYKELLTRFIRDEASAEEVKQLYAFIENEPDAYDALMQMEDMRDLATEASGKALSSLPEETGLQIRKNILAYAAASLTLHKPSGRLYAMRKWYAVAASIFVLLGVGFYFFHSNAKQALPAVANAPKEISAPVTSKAMITLANGTQIFLDSMANGQLAQVGNVTLVKQANGQIAYQMAGTQASNELQYNTLTNPKGSKVIDMQLSDGSHVWLNAGSSITYPVAFAGNERKVQLDGEGYFEIARDVSRKFMVNANATTTEVLGTHFNVNAYANNESTKITLLEGSVRETAGADKVILRPGQQAQVAVQSVAQTHSGNISVINNADIEKVMAWKNGLFNFNGESLSEVMKQLERWYDVEVQYTQGVPQKKLIGKMTKDVTLNGLLIGLKELGVNCRLEGRKLIVSR